jgi:putative salt-induced outer membrane protein
MKRTLFALLLVAVQPALAQQNPPAAPVDPLTGEVALGYLATSGNTNSTNANATFGLLYQLARWAHEFDASAVSAATEDVTTAEAYSAKYEGRRSFGEGRPYLFTSLDWQRDRFSAYDEQMSEAVGYGRRFLNRPRQVMNAEIGAGARQSTLIDQTEENEAIIRAALDYQLTLTETTGFKQDFVVESGESNTSFESISALRARLIGNIGLVISYRVKSNSDVPPGIVATDRFTSIALEYAF